MISGNFYRNGRLHSADTFQVVGTRTLAGATPEDVWEGAAVVRPVPSGEQFALASSSAEDSPPKPQIGTITISGTVEVGDTLAVNDGTTSFSYAVQAGDTTTDQLAAALAALIDADPLYATSVSGSIITVTGPLGVAFTFTDTTIDAGTLDLAATVNNTAIQTHVVGTGVRSVSLSFLDASGARVQEVVTLNGTTPVLTVATTGGPLLDIAGESFGSTGAAVGNVDIGNNAGTVFFDRIGAGKCEARAAAYTVPAGFVAFLSTHGTAKTAALMEILSDCNPLTGAVVDGARYVWHSAIVRFAPGSEHVLGPFPAGSTVWARATESAGTVVNMHFEGYLEIAR